MARMAIEPLSRYPAIRTSRVDEFEHRLKAVYGASGFVLPKPAELVVRGNFVRLDAVALGFGACGTDVTINFGESDFARLQLPICGQGVTRSGGREAIVGPGGASMTSPGRAAALDYGVDLEQLFLRVDAKALRHKLEILLDAPVRRPIEFELACFADRAMLAGLRQLVGLLAQQLDDEHALLSPLALREMEQAVIVQLLYAARHNFSAILESEPLDPAALPLRRVEAYIEANWNRPIAIDTLVEVAGVSARSLYKGFGKLHGCPPMVFAKRIRLRRARDLLMSPDGSTSVTGVALACGFSNLGHFARDYRSTFGELPSRTLRLSQGSPAEALHRADDVMKLPAKIAP